MPLSAHRLLKDASGALGDLGTLLPLSLGAIGVAGLAPMPVLLGFAVFYLTTGFYYRLPIPVQPMKAVTAVLLTTQVGAGSLVASGVMIGAVLLLLGLTGWVNWLSRLVPRSVLSGLQLGLGLMLANMSLELIATSLPVGLLTLAVLVIILRTAPYFPAALVGLCLSVIVGGMIGSPGLALNIEHSFSFSWPELPDVSAWQQGFTTLVLPQLALTLTNAILLTALMADDYFGEQSRHVTPARLSLSSGLANLVLVPLGALPMCHGAGGLAAHYRFGARTGLAPILLGSGLVLIAVLPGGISLIAAIPAAGLDALLLVAAAELAFTKRLRTTKPSCWPVIGVTALVTFWVDAFWGLLAGMVVEAIRAAWVRKQRTA
ncbi:benzoate transporter [Vreelandella sulfidaeris]|uniref:Benzoate transporter n=1 Tax=Vreelandella sulfidaeris TaxID=115553 RepID=A0A365TTI8_9GAMM|nr:putative sulfate/molybdate transporter [Halomonas sulfidaeris]RBI69390.1 benzoate transporter [Halomonas sulfidaeris]